MLQVTGITSYPKQQHQIALPDGTTIDFELEYRPQQFGWFFNYITYGTKTIRSMRLVTGLNLLYQFRNSLPFGICITTVDNSEPFLQEDFENERAKIYILDESEITELVEYYGG